MVCCIYLETPPRTWGRLYSSTAGSTITWKHPHARGEDTDPDMQGACFLETPPRTWGRLKAPTPEAVCAGNTPTHVGKTKLLNHATTRYGKHPHARGEDVFLLNFLVLELETPPRTWGRPGRGHRRPQRPGNTPTHVGKTPGERRTHRETRKHPHARGEDTAMNAQPSLEKETPPRTWGRPSPLRRLANMVGNTPTHVGKTQAS